ncbi:amidohydrolase family protein [Bradyrhizobium pachyrhizi]|uniref:amidohydrolase family protein n=1 Tax=Bradyrhizobium pachyrhizi TaxID=280333 RepID=UPI003D36B278
MDEGPQRRSIVSRRAAVGGLAALASAPILFDSKAKGQVASGAPTPGYNWHYPASAWLARREEAAIEPDLEVVDAHHHLWDHPGDRFLFDKLLSYVTSGHKITDTVFVECGSMYRDDGPVELQPVGETEFVNGVAAMSASGKYGNARLCRGIVGYADLRLGEKVTNVLEGHLRASGRFRGVRFDLNWDPSPMLPVARNRPGKDRMDDPIWRAGFSRLAPLGLVFDAYVYHPQLRQLIDLARAFPETTIVLNHSGTPLGIGPYRDKKAETFAQWKQSILELAKYGNVVVKLGGLGMAHGMFDFYDRDRPPSSEEMALAYKPYIETCIQAFTPQRSMFESNFPPDESSGNYTVLWNAMKRLAAGYNQAEKQLMFSGTAKRVYNLI